MIVYYTAEQIESRAFAERILKQYGIAAPQFVRGEHGKPRLIDAPVSFNLTHTHGCTFCAVGNEELGLDAEWRGRPLPRACSARLTAAEQKEDFFRLWTAKEAYVKYLGGTLAGLLPSLRFEGGVLLRDGIPVSENIAFCETEQFTLALCTASPQQIELLQG